jgi:hypothetical protein
MGTARILEPGRTRLAPAIAVAGGLTGRPRGDQLLTELEFGFAHGVAERAEIGAKAWATPGQDLWSWGAEANTRVQLWRSPDPNSGVDIALLPRVSYAQLGTGGTLYHTVAADLVGLVGINVGELSQVVLGVPILGIQTWFEESAEPLPSLRVGGSVGFAWYLSQCFVLMPELAFLYATLEVDQGNPMALFQATVSVYVEL